MINRRIYSPLKEFDDQKDWNNRFGDFHRWPVRQLLTIPPYTPLIDHGTFDSVDDADYWMDASTGGAGVSLSISDGTLKSTFTQASSGQVAKFQYYDTAIPFDQAIRLELQIALGASNSGTWVIKAAGTTIWEGTLSTEWEDLYIEFIITSSGALEIIAPNGAELSAFDVYIDNVEMTGINFAGCEWVDLIPSTVGNQSVIRYTLEDKILNGSLVTIDDDGNINIPSGQSYQINGVALAASDVGAPRFRGVSSTTPSDPIAGDFWIDTTSGSVPKIYDGSSWISLT